MASSAIDICNAALAEVPADSIASLDENSLPARECRRSYAKAKEFLLGVDHSWSFARRRVALAAIVNDRDGEWAYAYTLPANVIPRKVAITYGGSLPLGATTGEYYSERKLDLWAALGRHIIAGTTLYTNTAQAVLEVKDLDVSESRFSPLFVRALELELALRLVMPITKNEQRERTLIPRAEAALQRAMAEDLNREPQTYGEFLPSGLAARL